MIARRRGAAALLLVAAALAAAPASATDGRSLRGVHEGRAYRLSLPAAPAPGRPLVVALHGCAQTPEDFALGTRLDRAAARRGLRVLYPAQSAFDNAARCWNWFTPPSASSGEVGALLALVREIQRAHDASGRIVLLGFSAGGYMAVNLMCAAPDVVAGIGVAAGGPYRCADSPRSAIACMRGERLDGSAAAARCGRATGTVPIVRASLWHGGADSVVSPANLAALTTMLLGVRGVQPAPTIERSDRAVRTVYRAAEGAPVIETWLVPGMGHAWSGGDARGSHTYPAGPDATEAMLRFLVDS